MSATLSQLELLELDVDTRLAEDWAEAMKIKKWTLEGVGIFMRSAYATGYADALREQPGERGKLCTDNGYPTPP